MRTISFCHEFSVFIMAREFMHKNAVFIPVYPYKISIHYSNNFASICANHCSIRLNLSVSVAYLIILLFDDSSVLHCM